MKHVLITGSTRGIGFGLAKKLIELGCKVTINGTTQQGVENSVKELKKIFPQGKIQGFQADVTNYNDLNFLWNSATVSFGSVDFFINNAGIANSNNTAWQLTPEEIKKVIEINLIGVINGSTIAFNNMLKQGHGQIFNMEGFGSDGSMGHNLTLYGTTKRAVSYYTQSLAKEAQNTPVLVGALKPGMVKTDMLLNPLAEYAPEERERARKIFNILADEVETVTDFLCPRILSNKENGVCIAWLTKKKIMWRFISSVFVRRNIF